MRKITMLAAANIRKNKSQAISLLIFALIATMFLYVGLVLYFDFGSFFDERAEQLHAPHLTILQEQGISTEEQFEWMKENAVEVERHPVISGMGEYYSQGIKSQCLVILSNADGNQSMNPPSLIGESLPLTNGYIYVPYIMKSTAGCKLGGDFRINLSGRELVYTIAGFTEEITFSSSTNLIYRFYINGADYRKLENAFPELGCLLMSSRFNEPDLSLSTLTDYDNEFIISRGAEDTASAFIWSLSYDSVKYTRVFIPMVVAMIVTAFAIILFAVSLTNIRFGIVNNIAESMVNIGTLKAVGYRNHQIILSILMQFGGITTVGGILGIIASTLLMPALSAMLESQSAMIWNPGFNLAFAVITLCFAVFAVLLTSFIAARRIFRLHPLTALRGGIETHNFKKNSLPLDTSRGSLSFLLAMKRFVRTKGQSIMITLIIAAVSFASVTGIAIYHNVGIQTQNFMAALMGEIPDVSFLLNNPNETKYFIDRLLEREEVRKAFGYQTTTIMAGNNKTTANIVKDCALFEGSMLIDGRYPKHSNEIAASGIFMKISDKKVGDAITIRQGDMEKDFLITGQIQTMLNNEGGNAILITSDGLTTIWPDYEFSQINVYLEPDADIPEFIENVKAAEGDIFTNAMNMQELIEASIGSMGGIFAAVAMVILMITVIVVVLVLYLVIKTLIMHRKREYGIQKAVGFTTLQIMNQISLGFMPSIILGVLLGGIGGMVGLNPLLRLLLGSMGIAKMNISAPIAWTVMTCAALWVLAYTVSMLIAWRIRKISAYSLVIE